MVNVTHVSTDKKLFKMEKYTAVNTPRVQPRGY